MKNILYINSTIREYSRTNELAKHLLKKLNGKITEIKLEECNLNSLNKTSLYERDLIIKNKDYMNEKLKYARQFAYADIIVIAAPFWDLSFPAILKIYIENISVTGITFKYSEDGRPIGLCKANKIYFVSTAGGKFLHDFGYNYIKTLTKDLFAIENSELIYAEGLDVVGNNAEEIVKNAKKELDKRFI